MKTPGPPIDRPTFVAALDSAPVLLMDGAMGTELQRAGVRANECYEAWNLENPAQVRAIHAAYGLAGSTVLLTNTLQANSQNLARFGLADRLTDIFQAGICLARDVLPPGGFVLADIGPSITVSDIEPVLDAASKADGLLLETFSDPALAATIMEKQKSGPAADLPLLLSFTFRKSERMHSHETFLGVSPAACAEIAQGMGAAALGLNCGRDLDLDDLLAIVRCFRENSIVPLFVKPNAGTPRQVDGGWIYPHTPEHMAGWVPPLIEAGVRMIGGCCGTTPAHIAAFRRVLLSRMA